MYILKAFSIHFPMYTPVDCSIPFNGRRSCRSDDVLVESNYDNKEVRNMMRMTLKGLLQNQVLSALAVSVELLNV
jgi:hypothetical protein